MVGSTIKVVATAENGNTFSSEATEEVGVYEALEILSAEQIAKDKVQVTFSAPASADDKLTVKKGANEVTFTDAFDDDTYLTKTLTFKNNLANGTYTVTLTPADEDVDPSSVEFEAKSSTKATRLEVTNDYLVMKDTNYKEGYFFIKGYNDFDEEIILSGLTINVAPSDSVSYDSSTGKVTVKYDDPGFAVVKNVSVFAQYNGANGEVLTTQDALEVTTIGYPSEVEFGDVKKDGTPRADGRITIAELGSNKYYVELNTVKDQYGNDLSAEDLNDLVTKEKLVTVIPTATSPIYFGTNGTPFTTKDGKVVAFLTPGNNMPGVGSFMITGAGGTFTKDITIEDDPYIDVLTVDVPDLYEAEWSSDFSFSATDQYDDEIDLYEFAPDEGYYTTKLPFTDKNHIVGKWTEITGETGGQWKVTKDTVNKTFKVIYYPAGLAKSMATFTTQPAGLLATSVQTATIGGRGTTGTIVEQGSAATIVKGKTSNIASFVKFKDANGKVMDRVKDAARYPTFLGGTAADAIVTNAKIDDDDITATYWTVSNVKLANNSLATPTFANSGWYDDDAVIEGQTTTVDGDFGVTAAKPTANFYITLLGSDGTNYKVLDSKAFRFIYVPASTTDVKYTVKDTSSMLLYAHPDSKDTETIKVIATNEAGETWEENADALTPSAPFTSEGAVVKGKIPAKIGDGSVSVKVYKDGKAIDTVQIAYSDDDRVATKTRTKLYTTDADDNGTAPEGADWEPSATLELETAAAGSLESMTDGVFTLTGATVWNDTFEAAIVDQYGVDMEDSLVKLNGQGVTNKAKALVAGNIGNFVITNGSQKIDIRVEANGNVATTKTTVTGDDVTSVSVKDEAALRAVLASASTTNKMNITLAESLTLATDAAFTVPAGAKLIIPSGVLLVSGGAKAAQTVTNNGSIVVNGMWNHSTTTLANNGDVTGSGHVTLNGVAVTQDTDGKFVLTGSTLVLAGTSSITGGQLGGHVEVTGNLTVGGGVELISDTLLDYSATGATITGTANLALSEGTTNVTVLNNTGDVLTINSVSKDTNVDDAADDAETAEVAAFLEEYKDILELSTSENFTAAQIAKIKEAYEATSELSSGAKTELSTQVATITSLYEAVLEAEGEAALENLSITNPTKLTAEQYENATTDDTTDTNVQKDLQAVVEALVIKALGKNYVKGVNNLEVTISDWTCDPSTPNIKATDTATYTVSINLDGATKKDESETTFSFENLPVGSEAAKKAAQAPLKSALSTLGDACTALANNKDVDSTAKKAAADKAAADVETAIATYEKAGTGYSFQKDMAAEYTAYTEELDKITAYDEARAAIGTNSQAGTLKFKAAVGDSAAEPETPGTTTFAQWETALKDAFVGVDTGDDCEFTWGASTFKATPNAGEEATKEGTDTTLGTSGDTNTITYTVTVSQAGYVAEFTATLNATVD